MRNALLFSVLAILSSGCAREPSPVDATSSEIPAPDFDAVIETIALSGNVQLVNAADSTLRNGGLRAIQALVLHIDDSRIPVSNYCTRAVAGTPDMGDHCFWLVQDMLETARPKSVPYNLSRDSIVDWLKARPSYSLEELRRDASRGAVSEPAE